MDIHLTGRPQIPRTSNQWLDRLPISLALCAGRLVERGAQPLGELDGVVIGPEMHEEQPRLLVQHVAVVGGYVDAVARNALITGFTSSPVRTKSPVIAALPPPVG